MSVYPCHPPLLKVRCVPSASAYFHTQCTNDIHIQHIWYAEIKWPFCQNAKRQRQNFLREAFAVDLLQSVATSGSVSDPTHDPFRDHSLDTRHPTVEQILCTRCLQVSKSVFCLCACLRYSLEQSPTLRPIGIVDVVCIRSVEILVCKKFYQFLLTTPGQFLGVYYQLTCQKGYNSINGQLYVCHIGVFIRTVYTCNYKVLFLGVSN